MTLHLVRPAFILAALILASHALCSAEEWTRFRGPNGSGISDAKTIPVQWTQADYNWVVSLPGDGHSSPVAWDGRVFVTSADAGQAIRYLLCIDGADGGVVWRREFEFAKYGHHKNNSSASGTPTVDADHVYVLWQSRTESPLVALDHAGDEVWRYDLGPYLHGQGPGTSPIVYRDLVIVCNDHVQGSFLLAVDRKTGKEVWKVDREGKRACYATPCVFRGENRPDELIFSHCFEGIVGVDPATGRQKWMMDLFGTHSQRAVGSPIVYRDLVIANSGALAGTKTVVAVRPIRNGAGASAEQVYRITSNAPHVPTTLVYQDLLFLWADTGIVSCLRAASGETVWRQRVGGNYFSSPVCVDGKLYGVELGGEVVVLRAAEEYELIARNPLPGPSRATPAVSGGVMYLRTYSHLCSLGGKPTH